MTLTRQRSVRFASFLGDNALDFYHQVVAALTQMTGIACELVRPASSDAAQCLEHQVQAAFLCGISYVGLAEAGHDLALLGAPVMAADRYRGRSVYFADFIVPSSSGLERLHSASGLRVGYNEAESFSGYVLPRDHLNRLGIAPESLGTWIKTGSHAASMDRIAAGELDLAAIDSVVLDMEVQQRPKRADLWRVITSSPPAPMPPVVIRRDVGEALVESLADGLSRLHTTTTGSTLLAQAGMLRFEPRTDRDYEPVRALVSRQLPTGVEADR